MIGQLHAGNSLSILLHAGIGCLASLAYDCVVTNGCFNPFDVSSYYGIAHCSNSLRIASGRQ